MSARPWLTASISGFVLVLAALVPPPASAMAGESTSGAGVVRSAFCVDTAFVYDATGTGAADAATGTWSLTCASTGATAEGTFDCLRVSSSYSGTFGIELRAEMGGVVGTASPDADPSFAAGAQVTFFVHDDYARFGPPTRDLLGVWAQANDCSDSDTGQAASLTSGELTISQADQDQDGVTDGRDDCPTVFNPWQEGAENNCPDTDSDGVLDQDDNCPDVSNAAQTDTDGDGEGDACDSTPNGDTDGDGVDDLVDNCPTEHRTGRHRR